MKSALTLLALLIFETPAHALVQVTGLLGVNFGAPTLSLSSVPQATSGSEALAWGFFCATPLFHAIEIESGFLFQNNRYSYTSASTAASAQFSEVQIPLLFRYKFDPLVGVGIGPYLGVGMSPDQTFSILSLNKTDVGIVFDLQALIPFSNQFAFTLDGRYQLGIRERSTNLAYGSYKTRSIQALGGVSYLF